MSVQAFIGLGGNLGDPRRQIHNAVAKLAATPGIQVVRTSTLLESRPVGGPNQQPNYLNGAAELRSDLTPRALLNLLLDVENSLGRTRLVHHGPRTIDLDLLIYDNEIHHESDLVIPHPRIHERRFVLVPMVEIAADRIHPTLGKTMRELLADHEARKPLDGHRVFITGATNGIGRAIALTIAGAGADVLIHGRDETRAVEVANGLNSLGARGEVLLADLADADRVQSLPEEAWHRWQGLDACILNAGADILTGTLRHASFADKQHALFQIDVASTMTIARCLGQRMKTAGSGCIITMGWDQADRGMEGDSGELFAAAKGAVMAFTRSLAQSLAPQVRVNCLAPGWIRTGWGASASPSWQERVLRETPLARWGTPEDVAQAALWLASSRSSFVTGQILRVNGGAL